jgi:hypothetical protein
MSVDYYSCSCCSESRYSEYISNCGECQKRLCTWCLINNDITSRYAYDYEVKYDGTDEMREHYDIDDSWEIEIGEVVDDSGIDPKYCPFCEGEEVSREDVFHWLMKKNGLNYDELEAEYLKEKISE